MQYPLTFQPYVGKNYQNQKFKILVLGESHYFGDEDMRDFQQGNHANSARITQAVIETFLNYKKGLCPNENWMQTFTKFSNATEGKSLSDAETVAFWERIAFYNFVQYPISGPRVSPTKEHFENSKGAFQQVLKNLQPDVIVFWGFRLWQNFDQSTHKKIGAIDYLTFGKDYPIYVLPHPASSALNEQHKQMYQQYLKLLNY